MRVRTAILSLIAFLTALGGLIFLNPLVVIGGVVAFVGLWFYD